MFFLLIYKAFFAIIDGKKRNNNYAMGFEPMSLKTAPLLL